MAESGEMTIIGADSHFKGELSFERAAKINGKFDGKILGKGELQISESALCKAEINAGNIQIDGTLEGNLHAKEAIRLNSKGVIRGDITAAKMVMAEGASLYGRCAIGPDAAKHAEAAAPSPAAGAQTPGRGEQQPPQRR